ncbi:MAG: hypothetical protein L0Y58_18510 [Verrucomicrobia subdivision 3 bacterium]|nr:hypothetical protein [Limisphaerales bacterium]
MPANTDRKQRTYRYELWRAAPLVAFLAVGAVTLGWLAEVSAALIIAATLLLVPEIKWRKKARPSSALVEEVSE